MAPVREVLRETALKYPPALVDAQLNDLARTAFHIALVKDSVGQGATICDLGGGVGLFSAGCAALGMRVTLVDDFQEHAGADTLKLHRGLGVIVESRDVVREGIAFPPNSFDAVTNFDNIQNWPASPGHLFHGMMRLLRPGAIFILSVPNDKSRRETSVAGLRFIAKDLGLRRVRILGRNWVVRGMIPVADHILRLRPSLCANLYLVGHK
jgi:2-polyprenyl-3-methyl-5-hydroxy-6-metoxy-1,4-benzoquinol methylase